MTPVEERILDGLATFRFLTRDQMHRIHVCRDKKHLGDILRRIVAHGYVGEMRFGVYPGLGRLPSMYYLKAKGAKALAEYLREDSAQISYTRGEPHFQADHMHRRACVDFHIALLQWLEENGKLLFYVPYYASGHRGADSTRLDLPGGKHFRPDALFGIERTPGKPELFAFEMCMNRHGKDTRRILNQLEMHREAILEGAMGDKLGIPVGNTVLFVFENADGADVVRGQAAADLSFGDCGQWLWFNDISQVAVNCASGWRDIFSEPVKF